MKTSVVVTPAPTAQPTTYTFAQVKARPGVYKTNTDDANRNVRLVTLGASSQLFTLFVDAGGAFPYNVMKAAESWSSATFVEATDPVTLTFSNN